MSEEVRHCSEAAVTETPRFAISQPAAYRPRHMSVDPPLSWKFMISVVSRVLLEKQGKVDRYMLERINTVIDLIPSHPIPSHPIPFLSKHQKHIFVSKFLPSYLPRSR